MATNRRRANGRYLQVDVGAGKGSGPANKVMSGDPVAVGALVGVALNDTDVNGVTVIDTAGVYELAVTGTGGAIAPGDVVYFTAATPIVDDTNTGVRFGVALEPVGNGATTSILVRIGYH